ncbi:ETEC_3214 domain-containing protein [Vibrio maritimus]|uniref:ETEC_3214 domain-containing protein n=1 Tax=Vibrio maritimus TaxID=990268 RepID=UPI003734EA4F
MKAKQIISLLKEYSIRVFRFLRKHYLAFFLAVFAIFSYLNDSYDFYNNYLKQKKAEDGLAMLNTGVSIQHVKSVFGAPIREEHRRNDGASQYLYSFKKFFLQVVYDNDNTVVFYAVTSKSRDFKPKVPYLTIRNEDGFVSPTLGLTFKEYSDSANFIWSSLTSKFFDYYESMYLGNPGNYRNLYLGYNPSGVFYGEIEVLGERDSPSEEELEQFRTKAFPNTFGVGQYLGDVDGIETTFGIGIDYYTSRDLPGHKF